MKHLILSFAVFLSLSNLFAQNTGEINGYYLTLKGDTVYGSLFNKNDMYLKFRSPEGKKKKFTPSRIKGFNIDGSDYISLYLPEFESNYYVKILDTGHYTLYSYETASKNTLTPAFYASGILPGIIASGVEANFKAHNSGMYIKKEGDSVLYSVPAGKRLFQNFIEKHFSDNPELISEIESEKSDVTEFIDIVARYNEWYIKKNKAD